MDQPRRVRQLTCILLLGSLTVACGKGPSSPGTISADSAGVEIVTNTRPAWAEDEPGWAVAQVPSLIIESDQGDGLILHQISSLARLASGGLAVVSGGSQQIFVFGADGALESVMGGAGGGPDEFRGLATVVGMADDSMAAYDAGPRRVVVFDPDGTRSREIRLETDEATRAGSSLLGLSTGDFIMAQFGFIPPGAEIGAHRTPALSHRFSPDGDLLASYGPFPGYTNFVSANGMGNVPFGAGLSLGVHRDHLVVGTGETEEARYFGPAGTLARIVRWTGPDRTLTQGRIEEFLGFAESQAPEAARGRVRDLFAEIPYPERFPPYEDLIVSTDGYLWIGEYLGPEQMMPETRSPGQTWQIFDPDGAWLGAVKTPEGLDVLLIEEAEVIGVYLDELGVESVRAYNLVKDGS